MSADQNSFGLNEEQLVRLTAYALNELGERERDQVASELNEDRNAQRFVDEMCMLSVLIRQPSASRQELSSGMQAVLDARLNETSKTPLAVEVRSAMNSQRRRRWAALVALAGALFLVAWPLWQASFDEASTTQTLVVGKLSDSSPNDKVSHDLSGDDGSPSGTVESTPDESSEGLRAVEGSESNRPGSIVATPESSTGRKTDTGQQASGSQQQSGADFGVASGGGGRASNRSGSEPEDSGMNVGGGALRMGDQDEAAKPGPQPDSPPSDAPASSETLISGKVQGGNSSNSLSQHGQADLGSPGDPSRSISRTKPTTGGRRGSRGGVNNQPNARQLSAVAPRPARPTQAQPTRPQPTKRGSTILLGGTEQAGNGTQDQSVRFKASAQGQSQPHFVVPQYGTPQPEDVARQQAQPSGGFYYTPGLPPAYPTPPGSNPLLGWREVQLEWNDGGWAYRPAGGRRSGQAMQDFDQAVDGKLAELQSQQQVLLAKFGEQHPQVKKLKSQEQVLRLYKQRYKERLGQKNTGGEQYEPIVDNPFVPVDSETALSTFSIDVDTASYANVRRFLNQNQLPPRHAVRIEELLNYFSYRYPEPRDATPFSVNMEVAACPWDDGHRLLRIGLKGKDVPRKKRPSSNLVFLLDVSGSMSNQNKLPLLKQALQMMVGELTEDDRVSIVTYAGNAGLKLDSTNGSDQQQIRQAIESLTSGGSTNGSAGIQLAYEKATASFIKSGTNRVILATDGDLNVGVTSDAQLVELIKQKAESGVFLTVLGFGQGNLKDAKLEKLADNGNGMYAYIDSLREARRVLIEQMSGSLVTIAKDVKIQVEFNPAEVHSYRLIGYENRVMAAADFRNDKKDAGEIGAGHTVTALYEIVPVGGQLADAGTSDQSRKLKYQKQLEPVVPADRLTAEARTGDMLTLYLRYKQPDSSEATEREYPLKDYVKRFGEASTEFRFAAGVASFGMLLRHSQYRGETSFAAVEEIATSSLGEDEKGYRAEFVDLVRKAKQLSAAH